MSNESTVKPKIEAKEWWLVLEHHKTPRVLFEKPDEIYETDVHVIEAQPALNRIAELEAQNHRQVIMISQLADECNSKDVTIAKLKACAEFYANKDNYSLVDEGRDYQSDYKCYELNETTYADEALGTKARTTLAEVAELEQNVKEKK